MIKTVSIIVLLLSFSLSLSAQHKLKIVIQDLENNTGVVHLELLDEDENHFKGYTEKIINNESIIIIDSLKTGKYAFRYIHDENNNKEMDTNWLGIPKEGYGFSNNASGTFGPPKFSKTLFIVKSDTTMLCTPNYINL